MLKGEMVSSNTETMGELPMPLILRTGLDLILLGPNTLLWHTSSICAHKLLYMLKCKLLNEDILDQSVVCACMAIDEIRMIRLTVIALDVSDVDSLRCWLEVQCITLACLF